ncbi:MAG TPA: trigger factor family protein, partial [Labilithrix sp.]|nr:trigger factor family protein [Labilithrix sp.]
MEVTVQRISPVVLELSVEIPADSVKAQVDKAYLNLGKKAHVKGFRPGKAPRDVLSRLFGPQVANDVALQGGASRIRRLERGVALAELLELLVDGGLGHLDLRAVQLEPLV